MLHLDYKLYVHLLLSTHSSLIIGGSPLLFRNGPLLRGAGGVSTMSSNSPTTCRLYSLCTFHLVQYLYIPSSITEQPDPRSRMIQTLRWYMSAFHAGRRSSVAKKPYNPILGETFQCYYDLPNEPPCKVSYTKL